MLFFNVAIEVPVRQTLSWINKKRKEKVAQRKKQDVIFIRLNSRRERHAVLVYLTQFRVAVPDS